MMRILFRVLSGEKKKFVRGMTVNALKCKYNGGTLPLAMCSTTNNIFSLTRDGLLFVSFKRYDEGGL
jgi:hypothetical protein